MKRLILIVFLTFLASSVWSAKDHCPEKILDTFVVEGEYLGFDCGDMCYAGIRLDSSEELYFLCGEEDADKYLGTPGNRVRVTINVEQFWNVYGGECSRLEAFHSAKILSSKKDAFNFEQCMNESGGETLKMQECMETSMAVLEKNIAANLAQRMINSKEMDEYLKEDKGYTDDECQKSLTKAYNAWMQYVEIMAEHITLYNDPTGTASRAIAEGFRHAEMERFVDVTKP